MTAASLPVSSSASDEASLSFCLAFVVSGFESFDSDVPVLFAAVGPVLESPAAELDFTSSLGPRNSASDLAANLAAPGPA